MTGLPPLRQLYGVPGPGQGAPVSNLPASASQGNSGNFVPPLVRRVILAKVSAAGTTNTSEDVAAKMLNPSGRLLSSFGITFEPDTPQPFTNYNGAVWSARVYRPATREGREGLLHELFGNRALPEGYETTSAMRGFLITATVTIPQTAAAANITGNWVCEAQWEPAIPMCPEEAAALYNYCDLALALPQGALAP